MQYQHILRLPWPKFKQLWRRAIITKTTVHIIKLFNYVSIWLTYIAFVKSLVLKTLQFIHAYQIMSRIKHIKQQKLARIVNINE